MRAQGGARNRSVTLRQDRCCEKQAESHARHAAIGESLRRREEATPRPAIRQTDGAKSFESEYGPSDTHEGAPGIGAV